MSAERVCLLVVRAGEHRALIPIEHVSETFRPLPVVSVRDAPDFVLGMAVVRGVSMPVVGLSVLLDGRHTQPDRAGRFVSLRLAGRAAALAVDEVREVLKLAPEQLSSLPPLFQHAAGGMVEELCTMDAQLHLLLSSSKILDAALAAEGSSL